MSTLEATPIDPSVYQEHVSNVNDALGAARHSAKMLFRAFRSAYELMHDSHPTDWRRFRKEIRCDESTINKMTKIVRSTFVMSNLDLLPEAWSTLYRIALISEEEVPSLEEALREGELTPRSRLSDVLRLVPAPTKPQSNKSFIRFNLPDIDPRLLKRLLALVGELEEAGVICQDVSKRPSGADPMEPVSVTEIKEAA